MSLEINNNQKNQQDMIYRTCVKTQKSPNKRGCAMEQKI